MTVLHPLNAAPPKGVRLAEASDALEAIHHADCAAAIWQRAFPDGFAEWIDGLSPEQLPSARVVLTPDRVADAVTMLCDGADTPASAHREFLISDAADLATHFATIMDAPYLRMRLDKVTTNACRKFHMDAVVARLVCTYRGSGTQYGTSVAGGDPEVIARVATGSPIVMRGSLWPETPKSGLLHRSPPIEGSGETRLLFVLDPASDPEQTADLHHLH